MVENVIATLSRLPQLGVLAIDGPDAATFLQGQATCDCRALSTSQGALGALCNLQGRMIVSFHVIAVDAGLRLVMLRDSVLPTLTHLKKYAVFSKVSLRDASSEYTVVDHAQPAEIFTDAVPFSVVIQDGIRWLSLRDGRVLGLADTQQGASLVDGSDAWRAKAIAAGELLIGGATADKFLPQALNYDVIDGVSFRKGCYTGQEVVARMHFKGKMKERLYVFSAANGSVPAAGAAIVKKDGQRVGDIVDAVTTSNGDGRLLIGAVVRHDAVAAMQGGEELRVDGNAAMLVREPSSCAVPDAP